jgi:DNA-binding transcriptional LysR family regulator
VELRHLRYFVAVAEAGNLSRAAEKLFIAQPPLSLQIRQFEDEIGAALFNRHPKGMKLTPAGEALLPSARDLLDRAAGLADAARKAAGSGTLTLVFVPSASSTVIPGLVRRLRAAHPGVELRLAEMISDEQHEALVAGRIDGGIARTKAHHPHVRQACGWPTRSVWRCTPHARARCRMSSTCAASRQSRSSRSPAIVGRRTSTGRSGCAAMRDSARASAMRRAPCTACLISSVPNWESRSFPQVRICWACAASRCAGCASGHAATC